MPLPVFQPPVPPSASTAEEVEHRLRVASFGDGYEKVVADGLNTTRSTWTVVWENLTRQECDAIVGFLRARGGVEPFRWQAPFDAQPKTWRIVPPWQRTIISGNVFHLRVQFREVFGVS